MVISTIDFINRESSAGAAVTVLSLTRLIEKAAILWSSNHITVKRTESYHGKTEWAFGGLKVCVLIYLVECPSLGLVLTSHFTCFTCAESNCRINACKLRRLKQLNSADLN